MVNKPLMMYRWLNDVTMPTRDNRTAMAPPIKPV
jgi:hypothetical protein